jgi:hypothetical protein
MAVVKSRVDRAAKRFRDIEGRGGKQKEKPNSSGTKGQQTEARRLRELEKRVRAQGGKDTASNLAF